MQKLSIKDTDLGISSCGKYTVVYLNEEDLVNWAKENNYKQDGDIETLFNLYKYMTGSRAILLTDKLRFKVKTNGIVYLVESTKNSIPAVLKYHKVMVQGDEWDIIV